MTLAYTLGTLRHQPLRAALSIAGIGLCVLLMLFLLGAYRGVSSGSLEYIHANRADLWVLQRNATNILRCTSVLLPQHERGLRGVAGVDSIAPVLLVLATVGCNDETATVYLAGYDPRTGRGGPPQLVSGRAPCADSEIVLDACFARKHACAIGDLVRLQDRELVVVGHSDGTNAFVVQYAFVTLSCARGLIGFPGLSTFYLVTVAPGHDVSEVAESLRTSLPAVDVFGHEVFVANNVREMQAGFLPFIYTIAALGLVVLTVILSLLLSIHILERRRELAVMKALGAPARFLSGVVVRQSLGLAGIGTAVGIVLIRPLTLLVAAATPELTVETAMGQAAWVAMLVAGVSVVSALVAMQRLRRIYALEAFA